VPERHIAVQRHVSGSSDAIWALFADFPNLADHWSGLKATRAIGDRTSGLGARRHVKLRPIGSMDETIIAWEDGRKIVTQNQPSATVPFKQAEATLTLKRDHDGVLITFDYRYVPRGGPLGQLTGPLIDRMLTANFNGMLAAIEDAALADD
jgi:Polyketide cyclase / dehydrase and lipid transport